MIAAAIDAAASAKGSQTDKDKMMTARK